ncbi:vitamin B12-dependent ribonucleotide reductase [Clostridia bacterium]|nr:vitamin B12-dependent ribonucleotide reductase [Clostridia bacterium]
MNISENAKLVLERRYLHKDEYGNLIETPEEMLRRVARAIAEVERNYDKKADVKATEEEFYHMMDELEFLPNSPTLMNAGGDLGQLAACFVLPVEDSMEGIFDGVKNAALIHKSGGGTGFSFSRLRPSGSMVKSTGGVASGPISFMKVYNAATEAVKQGGTRRGANMGILRVDHPDILDFISCKEDTSEINNFNISVALTDVFMEALANNGEYDLVDPSNGNVVGQLKAKEVFEKIAYQAWKTGEPGIVFIDRMNDKNTVPGLGEIESTNPCGEQPLLPYESCNLGSINLVKMLGKSGTEVDYDKLRETVHRAVHFLDNVIDANRYPLEEIERVSKSTRKIGLGVMGFADVLLHMGISYESNEAIQVAKRIMKAIDEYALEKSIELAEKRGVFSAFDKSIYKGSEIRPRNATRTTIAPTGTISLIAGVSSGIEPLFALAYERNVMDGTRMVEINPVFAASLTAQGKDAQKVASEILKAGGDASDYLPDSLAKVFITSPDVSSNTHVRMQAAFQEHTDNAVSKTVNMSEDADIALVKEVYQNAYKLGLKGITIYRDGSRDNQVLSSGKKKEKPVEKTQEEHIKPRTRPQMTQGVTEKLKIGCGNLYITVNYDEKGICEVFTNLGRGGGCPSQSEATSRLISIALRAGVTPDAIIEQLKGIRCQSTLRRKVTDQEVTVLSCPDAIGKALEKTLRTYIPTEQDTFDIIQRIDEEEGLAKTPDQGVCPECGSPVEHEGGCMICRACGYSKCG